MFVNGGKVVVEILRKCGIRYIFGVPGFQHLPIYDSIYEVQPEIKHILVRDEKNGAFMADGYARATNQFGICDATVGPGVTNLASGVAEAYYASIPLIVITSDVNSAFVGKGANQECDQLSILKPITKWSVRVENVEQIPELMFRAFSIAATGRPGPVHLDFPEDVLYGKVEFNKMVARMNSMNTEIGFYPAHRVRPDPKQVEKAAQLLLEAKNAVVIAGGGILISQAWNEVRKLAELLILPVATTISGKGAIPENHSLSLSLCGRFSRIANDFIRKADVILVAGCRLGELSTSRWSIISPTAKLIHMDVDASEIGKNYPTKIGLCGDAKLGLRDLIDALTSKAKTKPLRESPRAEEIQEAMRRWRASVAPKLSSDKSPINLAYLLKKIREFLPPDGILVTDGGLSTHWAGLYYEVWSSGRVFIAGRGQAAVGYGFPAAIGAKLAAPEKIVIGFIGDGGFGMGLMELETALRTNVPVIIIVENNKGLGYVKSLQHTMFGEHYISSDFLDTNYAEIARDLGCYGARIEDPRKIKEELRKALESGKPAVLDTLVTTTPSEMLPAIDTRVK